MTGAAPWRREEGGVLVLALHVQPGAKRTAVDGTHGEGTQQRLKVRLAAPPVDGKANAELLRFLADAFGVPLRSVSLVRGETSRQKVVRVDAPVHRPDRDWEAPH
ncbi:MAG: YggU family protein [Betaproteobacteria bacterium]|nr:YggU family protein [Betaproteobacteria bacterium]MCC7217587.1 YggU family protein [Burkholderiales bacterium]